MLVLGVTGGVGAGKSTVLDHMEEAWGAQILKADEAAHMLMRRGQHCYEKIVEKFGEEILDDTGEINRIAFGEVIFKTREKLEQLNGIVHPAVKEYICQVIADERRRKERPVLAIEAALLIEEGYGAICDELWYIYASEEVRRERLKTTRGYSDARVDGIFKNQCPEAVFRANCAVTIDTGISLEYTKEQVDRCLRERISD